MNQSQEALNRHENGLKHISFQQKSAALSLIITSSITFYYLSTVWPLNATVDSVPEGYGMQILSTILLLVLAQVVLQVVLIIGTGSASPVTVAEKTAVLKASRNAYYILTFIVFVAIGGTMLLGLNVLFVVNTLVLGFAVAEIAKLTSQLFYAHRAS